MTEAIAKTGRGSKSGPATAHPSADTVDESVASSSDNPATVSEPPPTHTPERARRLREDLGTAIAAVVELPRYRHLSIGELRNLILDPLRRNRIAFANIINDKDEKKQERLAGFAIWASVSEAVNAKIAEQIKTGVYPIRLSNEDWSSGDVLWLLDVVAPSQRLVTAVVVNFGQIAGERPVRVHPGISRLIDPSVLDSLRKDSGAKANSDNRILE